MKVAHVLRKYDPRAWGGTETVVRLLAGGLDEVGVESVFFAPRLEPGAALEHDPLAEDGHAVRRFRAIVPALGLDDAERRRRVSVGGNLLSLDLPYLLAREPGVDVVHSHALNRLGGIARTVARLRRVPFVVTIHGGYLDLPERAREELRGGGARRSLEWGKVFGLLVGARRVVSGADAVLTTNAREAELLRARHPALRVEVLPHGVPLRAYDADHREAALAAWPELRARRVLLVVGRIDAVKNQGFALEALPELARRLPDVTLVLAGAVTDDAYGDALTRRARELGVEACLVRTGGLPPRDPRLLGLLRLAECVLLPSVSETFGLVILEAWAAGTAVVASRTTGACALVKDGENGWLHDHGDRAGLISAVEAVLADRARRAASITAGRALVRSSYDAALVAGRVKAIYESVRGARR